MRVCFVTKCPAHPPFYLIAGRNRTQTAVEVDLDGEFKPEDYDKAMEKAFDDTYYEQEVCALERMPFG